ncbi:MAG: hypothetical protein P8N31_13005 [Planctomycetota bacterium]|nr:hypothetical protein [Planctomycetota bacterium]MDG2144465.1 hypothetical protein [Planctomycetota bacterium]
MTWTPKDGPKPLRSERRSGNRDDPDREPERRGMGPRTDDPDFAWTRQIYQVPDARWGFASFGREQHPGVCMGVTTAGRDGVFLKGRGAEDRHKHSDEALVAPSEANGMGKDTYFNLRPRAIPMAQVRMYHNNRWLGTLEPEVTDRLRERLFHLFDIEEGH